MICGRKYFHILENMIKWVKKNLRKEGRYMKFTKMQGIGNDYVYVNCFQEKVEHPEEVARKVSDRHFGIGSD